MGCRVVTKKLLTTDDGRRTTDIQGSQKLILSFAPREITSALPQLILMFNHNSTHMTLAEVPIRTVEDVAISLKDINQNISKVIR